jgi:hypothetical protein
MPIDIAIVVWAMLMTYVIILRNQRFDFRPSISYIIAYPAIVPVVEEDSHEASRVTPNTIAAAEPKSSSSVR